LGKRRRAGFRGEARQVTEPAVDLHKTTFVVGCFPPGRRRHYGHTPGVLVLREEEKSGLAHPSRGVLFITRLFPNRLLGMLLRIASRIK